VSLISGSSILWGYRPEEARGLKGKLHHAMRRLGYEVYQNPNRKDGRWKVLGGELHTFYRLLGFEPEKDWNKNVLL
jgi:hypothetical protein